MPNGCQNQLGTRDRLSRQIKGNDRVDERLREPTAVDSTGVIHEAMNQKVLSGSQRESEMFFY